MSGPIVTARTGPVVVVLGALALAAAACGGSSTASTKPASSQNPTTTTPAAPPGAFGSVAAVSGSSLEVQNPSSGQVTVNLTPSTTYSQTVPAAASDLAAGVCVAANAGQGAQTTPGQPFTARMVSISQPGPNGCPLGGAFGRARAGNGGGGGSSTTAPASGSNRNGNGARRFAGAFGKVTSVSGPTFVVASTRNGANTTTSVTTDASTTFTKVVSATQSTVAVGQCVSAVGPSDQTGAVTANSVAIRPPGPNGCFAGRGGPGGAGGANGGSGAPA